MNNLIYAVTDRDILSVNTPGPVARTKSATISIILRLLPITSGFGMV